MNEVHPTEPLSWTGEADSPKWPELLNWTAAIEAKLADLQSLDPAAAPDFAAEVADELVEALDDES